MALSKLLEQIRREGVWVLAGIAPLASVKVWALVAGPRAAEAASRIAPGDLVLAGLALAAAVEVLGFKKPWRTAVPPPAAFGWVAAAAISAVVMLVRDRGDLPGGAVKGSAREIIQLVEVFLVGYGWTLWAARERRQLDRALVAMGVAVTVNVVFALGQLASGAHLFHVRGLFAHRNALGVFLAVALPLLVAAGATGRKRHVAMRVWLLAVSAVGLAVMTSGGLFAAAAVGVIVSSFATSRRAGWAVVAALAAIAILVQPLALPKVREAQFRSVGPFQEVKRHQWTPSERLRRWAAVLRCVRENPTFGAGPGRYQEAVADGYLPDWGKGGGNSTDPEIYDVTFDEPGSQCMWEVAACEIGLAGCLVIVWFLASTLVRLGGARADGPADTEATGNAFAAGAIGAVVAVAVAGVFAAVFVQGVALPLVIVLALAERSREAAARSPAVTVPDVPTGPGRA